MGAYLSTPVIEKKSEDFTKSEKYDCGVSGMQGWRITMEDAFNCDPDMDNDVGFFAVYDGHGGGEVAMYCSHHLKSVLKDTDEYKGGKFENALKATFMEIDKKLKEPRVLKELKLLSQMEPGDPPITEEDIIKMEEQEEEEKDNAEEETKLLCEEATMNIEDLLAKYGRVVDETKEVMRALKNKDDDVTSQDLKLDVVSGSASSEQECKISGTTDAESPPVQDEASPDDDIDKENPSKGLKPLTELKPASGGASDKGAGTVTSQKLKKTFIKIKSLKSDDDSDDDDDYEGFESDEAMEGSSSEEDEESSDEEEESGEDEPLEIQEETLEKEDGLRTAGGMEEPGSDSGTTAVVALLHGPELHVANAGDSRCVLSRKGGVAFDMSDDHKPEDEEELARIKAAGGQVNLQGRVNGGLNLSRAIGDHSYKANEDLPLEDQMISAMPDVRSVSLEPGDEFMVVACDGIWNVLSSQEVVDFIRDRLFPHKDMDDNEPPAGPMKTSQICEELFDRCLAPDTMGDGTGCDNMTCIIVKFDQDWLKRRRPATGSHSAEEAVIAKTAVAVDGNATADLNEKGDLFDEKRANTDGVIPRKETTKRPLGNDTFGVVNGNGVPSKRTKAD